MRQWILPVASFVRRAVFPWKCSVCGKLFVFSETAEHAAGSGVHQSGDFDAGSGFKHYVSKSVCNECINDFNPVASPICQRCGVMFKERESDDHLCGDCIRSGGALSMARSSGIYDGALAGVIRSLKYGGRTGLAKPLGRLLFETFVTHYGERGVGAYPDLAIPVPLHKKRMRARGFNQAWLIMREWPKWLSRVPEASGVTINRNVCVRQRWTDPQAGLDRKKRVANIKGAFRVALPEVVHEKHVLMIDDVYTTGATAEECASELLKAGAARVDILTLARTL